MPSICLGNFSSFCPLFRDPSSSNKNALEAYEIGSGYFLWNLSRTQPSILLLIHKSLLPSPFAASFRHSPDPFLSFSFSSDFSCWICIACLECSGLCLSSLCTSSLAPNNAVVSLPKSTLSPLGKGDFRVSVDPILALATTSKRMLFSSGTLCSVMNHVTFHGIGNVD